MKVICCVDSCGGMMFNKRRQSRDIAVISDIEKTLCGKPLYINAYSEKLFENSAIKLCVLENFLTDAENEDFCFVENVHLAPALDKINEITVYCWNRTYPADFKLDIDIEEFSKTEEYDLIGKSHEKITKRVYVK